MEVIQFGKEKKRRNGGGHVSSCLSIFTSWIHSAGDGGAGAMERVILVALAHTEAGIALHLYELLFS